MELKVEFDRLRERKLFLATPCYGGQCAGMFARACMGLSVECTKANIPLNVYFLFNESLITRARNYAVDEFLRSDCQSMLFIDSDIGFDPRDVLNMLAMQAFDDEKYGVIGAPYPKKVVSWEKIKAAVDRGLADANPNDLEKYVGDYVFNPKNGQSHIPIAEPVEVLETGTGFMMISRKALEAFSKKFPEYMYKPDHVRTEHFDGSREIVQFFQAEIDPKSKRYLSEDYWFCVPSNTQVVTEDGIMSIRKIVKEEYSGKVKSLRNDGSVTWNRVVGWSSRSNKKLKKKWVRLNGPTDNRTKPKLICTDDHRVAVVNDVLCPSIQYVSAKDSIGKFLVRKSEDDRKHGFHSLYTKEQLSVLIGSLLGDSTLNKVGQYSMGHCVAQKEYLLEKCRILSGYNIGIRPNDRGFKGGTDVYYAYLPINAQTKHLRGIAYPDGVKRVRGLLSYVDEIALAYWYMDDGSISRTGKVAALATNSFSYEENIFLKEYFLKKWNLNVSIHDSLSRTGPYAGHKSNSIYFLTNDSRRFLEMIAKYIHPVLRYKLPEDLRDVEYVQISSERLGYAASYVNEVKYLPNFSSRLYDIEVENDHSFVASGAYVHNCQKAQEAGVRVWLCPWVQTKHVGSYVFAGSLADLAAAGVSATADPDSLGGKKKPTPQKPIAIPFRTSDLRESKE